jgi:hypothetical protein
LKANGIVCFNFAADGNCSLKKDIEKKAVVMQILSYDEVVSEKILKE